MRSVLPDADGLPFVASAAVLVPSHDGFRHGEAARCPAEEVTAKTEVDGVRYGVTLSDIAAGGSTASNRYLQ